jgi:hypothetical protein
MYFHSIRGQITGTVILTVILIGLIAVLRQSVDRATLEINRFWNNLPEFFDLVRGVYHAKDQPNAAGRCNR